jgi:hypothetical protein
MQQLLANIDWQLIRFVGRPWSIFLDVSDF